MFIHDEKSRNRHKLPLDVRISKQPLSQSLERLYRTSTLVENQDAPVNAYDLIFHSDSENYSPNCYWQVFSRENGMSVRPVCNIVDD